MGILIHLFKDSYTDYVQCSLLKIFGSRGSAPCWRYLVAEEVNPAVDIWYQRECSLVKVGSIDEGVETSAASKMAWGPF